MILQSRKGGQVLRLETETHVNPQRCLSGFQSVLKGVLKGLASFCGVTEKPIPTGVSRKQSPWLP